MFQDDLIAMVGHEMRNILHVLLVSAEVAQLKEPLESREADRILRQARQLDRLVSDLIDAHQIDNGRLQLRRERSDLTALLRACVEEAASLSSSHRILLEAPSGPLYGPWDGDRLTQVIRNLLSNAIKYSPRGGEVLVKVEAGEHMVAVSVADHGVGIAPDAVPRLFDRFYRAPETAGRVGGMGVGLHVCKQLVEAHGGTFSVVSQPGQGTTITFRLPRNESAHEAR
jgi:signal transduction histidine kinase